MTPTHQPDEKYLVLIPAGAAVRAQQLEFRQVLRFPYIMDQGDQNLLYVKSQEEFLAFIESDPTFKGLCHDSQLLSLEDDESGYELILLVVPIGGNCKAEDIEILPLNLKPEQLPLTFVSPQRKIFRFYSEEELVEAMDADQTFGGHYGQCTIWVRQFIDDPSKVTQ